MQIHCSRKASFLIVALVYILATVVGVVAYMVLPFAFWLKLLLADIIATAVIFLFSVLFENASVYDPYWSVQPIVIVVGFAIAKKPTLAGVCLLVAISFWGVRLTANWAYTFHGLTFQDWRYTMLKEKTGKAYPFVNFTGIHLVPTLIVYGCVLPAVFVFEYAAPFHVGTLIFSLLAVCSALLQGVADIQMHKFRKAKKGGFIRDGLWKHSRHPNYLGEICMWWCVGIASVFAMPSIWYLLVGALCNTLLFLIVSIPMADKRQAKKEGFAEYKLQTRMLLPIKH